MGPARPRTTDRMRIPKPVRHSLGLGWYFHLHLTESAEYTYGFSQTRKDTQITHRTHVATAFRHLTGIMPMRLPAFYSLL